MAKKRIIKVGDRFGKLTIIKEVEPNITPCGTRQRKFLCKCECGNVVVRTSSIIRNQYANCGCDTTRHRDVTMMYKGMVIKKFLLTTYIGMKRRCYDVNLRQYKDYGGRGIIVCDEWKNDFFSFYDWSIANGASKELTLDRRDNDGDYCPANCRWVDRITQANNARSNRILECNGVTHTLSEWARITNIGENAIRWRLDEMHVPIEQALGFVPINFKQMRQPLTFKGETLSIPQWSEKLGIKKWTIYSRIRYGLPIEEVLNPHHVINRERNELQRLKRSLKSRGGNNIMYGKHHTEEAKKKMSKPILQITTDGNIVAEYYGATQAHNITGIHRQTIVSVLNGRGKTAGGFVWKYKEDMV